MTTKLEQAAQQVLQHWASSEDLVGAITALREALEHPERNWPSGGESEQAEQEPVVTERQFKLAMKQWDDWKAYALELQERLVKYEGGSPMLLNTAPQPVSQEPVAWIPLDADNLPHGEDIDILMADGSVLIECLTQADGDIWWAGSGIGERFIDPKYASVTHWRKHCQDTAPQPISQEPVKREHMTNGSPCWCNPELNYKDPETGAEVWVHKEPQ